MACPWDSGADLRSTAVAFILGFAEIAEAGVPVSEQELLGDLLVRGALLGDLVELEPRQRPFRADLVRSLHPPVKSQEQEGVIAEVAV